MSKTTRNLVIVSLILGTSFTGTFSFSLHGHAAYQPSESNSQQLVQEMR